MLIGRAYFIYRVSTPSPPNLNSEINFQHTQRIALMALIRLNALHTPMLQVRAGAIIDFFVKNTNFPDNSETPFKNAWLWA